MTVNRGILGDFAVAIFGDAVLQKPMRWYHKLRHNLLAIARVTCILAAALTFVWACLVAMILLGRLL